MGTFRKHTLALWMLLLVSISIHAQHQQDSGKGYQLSLQRSYDMLASSNPALNSEGFFNFHLTGFKMVGLGVGRFNGKEQFQLSAFKGEANFPESIEDPGVEPLNKEVELQKAYSFALTYRKQVSRIKNSNRIVVNAGGRISAVFNYYRGVKAFREHRTGELRPSYTFGDFRMTTGGIEAAPYLEVGKHPPGRLGIFLNWELLYFRLGYYQLALGAQKVSIILKF